jgi:hypothetical protein
LLLVASLGFSFVFACAAPFSALATLAALNMPRRDVTTVVASAWASNQIIGYGILNYPQTWDSFAWGGAIGIGAVLGAFTAIAVSGRMQQAGRAVRILASFAAAFAAYQAVIFVAGHTIGGGFSAAVAFLVLKINAGALAGLLVVHRLAVAIGLVSAARVSNVRPAMA